MHQQLKFLKTLWEKEKLLLNKQFLHFPQCFLLNQIIVSPFHHIFDIISLVAFELEEPKISISGKGLNIDIIINRAVRKMILRSIRKIIAGKRELLILYILQLI